MLFETPARSVSDTNVLIGLVMVSIPFLFMMTFVIWNALPKWKVIIKILFMAGLYAYITIALMFLLRAIT